MQFTLVWSAVFLRKVRDKLEGRDSEARAVRRRIGRVEHRDYKGGVCFTCCEDCRSGLTCRTLPE